jgi:drug/metabolite transporter (DMT)-like permease
MTLAAGKKSYLQLHGAVFLFGFAAILGDRIQIPAIVLVWWRLLITLISLVFLVNLVRHWRKTPSAMLWRWTGIGVLVTLHWIAFFASIKLANASVALVCLATAAAFASILEPLVNFTRPHLRELLLAILVVPCMILMVSGLDVSLMAGVWTGLISAALLALFGVLNKKLVHEGDPMFITFIEMGAGWLLIGIFLLIADPAGTTIVPQGIDWLYLVLLALGCTTLGYVLVLHALRHLSAFTAMLALNLEPVYGMILAYLLLDDAARLSWTFYLGGSLILALIFIHSFMQHYRKPAVVQ